jgi:putative DNA methylase
MSVTYKKKLIEVALPLDAINKASAREKSIRHGHPSTLHLWWARRPLAAARAVIFAQMVDDPSAHPDLFPTEKKQEKERQRLFRIIEDLVLWENTTNEKVLQQARDEIWQSWRYTCAENAGHPRAKELFDRHKLPAFHDPFAGGGSLPLEAQRLGLEAYASDLNPVAVLINKAMIEIPPKFAGKPPVNPNYRTLSTGGRGQGEQGSRGQQNLVDRDWHGAQGLAEDVRYYGQWMRDEAEKRIGHLYPKIEVTTEMAKARPDLKKYAGKSLTVIAWLWARTVKSPNPAFAQVDVPLVSTFMLSTKAGKEAYVWPVIEGGGYSFTVKMGKPKDVEVAKNGTKLARGANFRCLMSNAPMSHDYVRGEFQAKRNGERLMAIVVEGEHGRVYLSPTPEQDAIARNAQPAWRPEQEMNQDTSNLVSGRGYGITHWHEIFTPRQLVALTTFSDLVQEARERVNRDALAAGLPDPLTGSGQTGKPLDAGGTGATAYADAVGVYLALAVDRMANTLCTIARWTPERQQTVTAFARQALPMTWDFPDVNPFANAAGDYGVSIDGVIKGIPSTTEPPGFAKQADASTQDISQDNLVSTDPPYYDNIGYADLSDFFYIWLRRSLKLVFPDLFATLAVPKAEELVATPYRHGSKEKAEQFFLQGMTQAMHRLAKQAHPAFPVTVYYAFKQSESDGADGTASTGWETFLDAVIRAGFAVTGTWPMRTELGNRMIGSGTNALASSIIIVCRQRRSDAPTATRREFIDALRGPSPEERRRVEEELKRGNISRERREQIRTRLEENLPAALALLQRGNIAPVDLAQAAIGPGMAVYTRYAEVLDAEGKPLSVRDALALINQTLDEALAEQEGDLDADSRWALAWFEQSGFAEGEYGVAETLSKAKNTSVKGMEDTGILASSRGKVRLLKPDELPADWDPVTDKRLTAWEGVHQLIRSLEAGGEGAAAELVAKLGSKAEIARELAYRLYTICERKKRAEEALSYNALVQSWPEIMRLARESGKPREAQTGLFNDVEGE